MPKIKYQVGLVKKCAVESRPKNQYYFEIARLPRFFGVERSETKRNEGKTGQAGFAERSGFADI